MNYNCIESGDGMQYSQVFRKKYKGTVFNIIVNDKEYPIIKVKVSKNIYRMFEPVTGWFLCYENDKVAQKTQNLINEKGLLTYIFTALQDIPENLNPHVIDSSYFKHVHDGIYKILVKQELKEK